MLPLSGDTALPVQVKLDGTRWSVSSASSTDYMTTWPIQVRLSSVWRMSLTIYVQYNRLHATGYISEGAIQDLDYARLDLDVLRGRMKPLEMNGE